MPTYEGLIKIADTYALGTGGSVPIKTPLMVSGGAFGGSLNVSTPVMAGAYQADYMSVDGSVSFDASKKIMALLKSLIMNRSVPFSVEGSYSGGGSFFTPQALWTEIDISGQEGVVSGNLSFASETLSLDLRSNYIDNKIGTLDVEELKKDGDVPALNALSLQGAPIPFWKTNPVLSGLGTAPFGSDIGNPGAYVSSWSINFSQSVERVFGCIGDTTALPPYLWGLGPIECQVTLSLFLWGVALSAYEKFDMVLTIGDTVWNFDECILESKMREVGTDLNLVQLEAKVLFAY